MAGFQDDAGNLWQIDITFGSLLRVKKECGFDLLELFSSPQAAQRLSSDPQLLLDVLVSLLRPQLDELGVTPAAFADGLRAEQVQEAMCALFEALPDYFPEPQRGALKARVCAALTPLRRHMDAMLGKITMPTTDELQAIEAEVTRALVNSTTGNLAA